MLRRFEVFVMAMVVADHGVGAGRWVGVPGAMARLTETPGPRGPLDVSGIHREAWA